LLAELVAEYLINKNYNTFALLTELEKNYKVHPNQIRVLGFINKLKEQGYEIDQKIIHYVQNDLEEAMESALNILKQKNRPQVIFATTDLLAVAVIKAARKLKISIPEKLGIIGFDGSNTSDFLDLTTVDQSLEESGKIAVELLMKRINNPEDPIQTIYLPLTIVERATIPG